MMKVPYNKATNASEAYALASEQITDEYIEKFKVKTELKYDDAKKKITATGKGFMLELQFGDSDCDVNLDLGFLYKPLRGKILETIERKIQKHV